MNATIENIVKSHIVREMTQITNDTGMNNILTWCIGIRDMTTIINTTDGEMVVIPDDCFKLSEESIDRLFKQLGDRNASGVIFIRDKKLTPSSTEMILEYSQRNNLAVFVADKSKDMFTYVKMINKEICYLEDHALMEETLLTDFIFKDRHKLMCAIERLESLGINSLDAYEVTVVIEDYQKDDTASVDYRYKLFKNEVIRNYDKQVLAMMWDNMLILALQVEEEGVCSKKCMDVLEMSAENIYGNSNNVKIVMGRGCRPISNIRISFDQALFTVDMYNLLKTKASKIVRNYDEVGFYRILRKSHNPEEFLQFYKENLGIITTYDEQNNSNLVETLEIYIKNNCNLVNTAEELFLHKNSLRYRLQRIEDLTGKDLKNVSVISDFYVSFQIRNYMGVMTTQNAVNS